MIVIFVKKDGSENNEDVIFLGCCNDMETCKQIIIKNTNEYIKTNDISYDDMEYDESYYVVFDENTKEEKKKFFVKDFELKVTVEIEKIE